MVSSTPRLVIAGRTLELGTLLPGIKINAGPNDFVPINRCRRSFAFPCREHIDHRAEAAGPASDVKRGLAQASRMLSSVIGPASSPAAK